MYFLKVRDYFGSAHFLRGYKGKCENLHGHNWEVIVKVGGRQLDEKGLLLDFGELKKILRDVLKEIDHKVLNEIPPFIQENPSAENISKYIYNSLCERLPSNVKVEEVEVWETPWQGAVYYKDEGD